MFKKKIYIINKNLIIKWTLISTITCVLIGQKVELLCCQSRCYVEVNHHLLTNQHARYRSDQSPRWCDVSMRAGTGNCGQIVDNCSDTISCDKAQYRNHDSVKSYETCSVTFQQLQPSLFTLRWSSIKVSIQQNNGLDTQHYTLHNTRHFTPLSL